MKDREASLNEFLAFRRRSILQGSGSVSNSEMERLALAQYAKYNARRLKVFDAISEDVSKSVEELKHTAKPDNSKNP
jgi:hypothetical protein